MDALIRIADKVVEYVCKVMLLIQLVVVSGVVFGRYVYSYSPAWGEELALFAMVWFGLLSASTRVRDDAHLVQGINLVDMTRNNSLPGMGISSSFLYASVPAAGLAIIIQLIARARDIYGHK